MDTTRLHESEPLPLTMFGRDSGDIDVVCPYNSSHIFPAKGLNGHLVRCRKNYMHLKKVACKFDVTHLVLKPELAHHHSICPSRIYLDRDLQMRAGGSKLMGNVSGPDIRSSYTENTGENWDSEPSHPGTNAIFSRASEFENGDVTITQNHSESAVPLLPTSSSSPTQEEENFCRVPLASSKAAQLSAAMAPSAKPRGSSNLVYEYSLQQAAVGRGRGLVTPPQGAQQATPVMLLQEPASPRSGVGRGNGSGAQLHSSPQRPSVGQRLKAQLENSLQQAVPKDQTEVSSEANTGVIGNFTKDFSKMSTEELSKAKKKLVKKLKQISALEMKALTGTVLSSDEEAKLKKKADILVAQDQLDRYL